MKEEIWWVLILEKVHKKLKRHLIDNKQRNYNNWKIKKKYKIITNNQMKIFGMKIIMIINSKSNKQIQICKCLMKIFGTMEEMITIMKINNNKIMIFGMRMKILTITNNKINNKIMVLILWNLNNKCKINNSHLKAEIRIWQICINKKV